MVRSRIDKIDSLKTYFDNFCDGFIITLASESGDRIIFTGYDLRKTYSGDSRLTLIEIEHMNCDDDEHKVCLCVDIKNHNSKMPFHLNVDWKSSKIECSDCNSYFTSDYPEGLNHMPLPCQKGIGTGNPYKIIRHELTVIKLLKHLRDKGFFNKYNNHEVNELRPTTRQFIRKIESILTI